MTTLLKGGHLIDPLNGVDRVADVLLKDGKIAAVETSLQPVVAEKTVDASGLTILPGMVDMHVHLRDPGFIHKEDVLTGSFAAAAGGITSILCMPNTKPVIDSKKVVEYIKDKAKEAKAHVYITGAISKRLKGDELCNFEKLKKAGIIAVSDDGRPVENAAMMVKALCKAKELGLLVTSHCEDLSIIDGGIIHEGSVSAHLGVKGMHRSSEDSITAREIVLAETNGCPVHIAHVSTKLSVQLIREAKARGVRVTAETCPHYFVFTEQELLKQDADYRMNPPLREEEDRRAILEGLLDGTIDCIVTDHAPHAKSEKKDFLTAPNGVIGMETSFAACYTYLVRPGHLTLAQLLAKMCFNPAKILGIQAGSLAIGEAADLTLIDLDKTWIVDPKQSHSRARNCIFKNVELTGEVQYTFLGGKRVYDAKRDQIQAEKE